MMSRLFVIDCNPAWWSSIRIASNLQPYVFALILGALVLTQTAQAQSTDSYQYDALGRLTAVQTGDGAKTVYQFDKADNRTNVRVSEQFANSWNAVDLYHLVGFRDGDTWAASVELPAEYLTYGPYTYAVPAGNRTATYRLWVDDNSYPDTATILTLDVFDAGSGEVLASRQLTRHDWLAASSFQVFELPFMMDQSRVGHPIEFRIYYHRFAYVKADKIGFY